MKSSITIWHNNACSTSKKILSLLQENFDAIEVRHYITNPPSVAELKTVLAKMNERPVYILRKKDKVYQELFADQDLSDAQWLKAMSTHPSMIERPIIITENKAWLARPAAEFEQLIKDGLISDQ